MFKYSVNNVIYGQEPLEKSIKRIAASGYDGVEIVGEPYSLKVNVVRGLLKEYGLEASSICGIYTSNRDLSSANTSMRLDAIRYVKDCITFANELGTEIVIVVPSLVGRTNPVTSLKEEWKLACGSIREAGKFAADFGVQLVIEPVNRFEAYLINKTSQALKLRDEVGLENVGVMIDSFHMNIEEKSIPEAIKKAAGHLRHVHIADSNREAAGFGHIDFRSLLKTLLEVKYKGYITMEFVLPKSENYKEDSPKAESEIFDLHTRQSINFMKKLCQELVGFKDY